MLVLSLTLCIKACFYQKYRTTRVTTRLLSTIGIQQKLLRYQWNSCLRYCYVCNSFSETELSQFTQYHHSCTPLLVWRAVLIKTYIEANCFCCNPACDTVLIKVCSLNLYLIDTGHTIASSFLHSCVLFH